MGFSAKIGTKNLVPILENSQGQCPRNPIFLLLPGLKTNRAGKFDLSGKQKNGGSSEQAFAPSFLPSPEAEEKAKIQKKVLDTGHISKPFSTWRIPHASERNARK